MSKNLTRKGLALGAIVALGTSLFAGAPAFAGVESTGVTLVPSAGTTYSSIAGSAFSLNTVVNSNIETATVKASKLSYLITNAGEASVKVTFKTASADVSDYANHVVRLGTSAATIGATSVDAAVESVSLTNKAIVVTGNGANVGYNSASVAANKLVVTTSTDATENVVLTVQAFVDENGNGKIDEFDLTSAARTLTFIPAANVTATTSITSAVIGASTITGKVVLGNDINMANLGTDVKIGFKKDGVVIPMNTGSATSSDTTSVSYDSTELALVNLEKQVVSTDANATDDIIRAGTIVAQAYYKTTSTKLGAASNAATPANGYTGSVDSTDALEVTASKDVKNGTTGVNITDAKVRAGYTGNVTFTSKVTWRSTDALYKAAGAGVTVKVTLTNRALDAASSFVAGGKTLTATSGAQSFTVVTDADGKISFTGAGTGKSGDSVDVSIKALKANGSYTTAQTGDTTITWTAAAPVSPVVTNAVGAGSVLKITKGATYSVNYAVVDQFGSAWTATGYRLSIATSGNGTSFAAYTAVVDGKVSQSIVDNSTATGNLTVQATLQKLNAAGDTWVSVPSASQVDKVVYVNSVVAAAVSGTASSSTAVATITKSLVTADLRVDNNTQTTTSIGYGATATQTISGVVTDATGAAVAGAVVTVTGAGLAFVVDNKVYSVGSATINTTSTGTYSVDVYSTTAGKASVVVTSGAATKSVAIEFSGVTALAETNVVSIDVASLSQVGRSVTATVKVVDKFANPVSGVAVAVAVTGVGSLSAATVTTDATGKGTVQFVAGANDFGDAVFTAKYTATDAAATVVSATKTITVGITDAQVDVVGKRVTAVASFSKGKTVAFYVNGEKKWSKLSASDADVVLNYNLKKGRNTVTVKISGGFVTTEVIVVK